VSEEPQTTALPAAPASSGGSAQDAAAQLAAQIDERPELAVGAAFGGGLLLALILKRLAA
jgi:hypothetical protein